jgi:hypothetical protein
MAIKKVLLTDVNVLSVTFTTTVKGLPVVVVGVPLMLPLPSVVTPGGNPVTDQEYGVTPPVALKELYGYGTFTTPVGSGPPVRVSGRALIAIVKVAVAVVPLLSLTVTVTVNGLPATDDGLPEIRPPLAMLSPGGNPAAVKE